MKPSSKLSFKLFVIFVLALEVYSSSFPTKSILEPQLADDETILSTDYDGFFVEANLTTSDPTTNDTVRMILSLSNNNVLLIDNCADFQPYNCKYYHCIPYPGTNTTVRYQSFNATTIPVSATVELNNQYWQLQEKALLATSCEINTSQYLGAGRYGVLGLGTQGSSKNNFLKDKIFSIWLNSTAKSGVLKFGFDQKYANGTVGNITANDNWIVPVKGYIQITPYDQDFNGFIAFDLYGDALGFPLKLYKYIVDTIVATQWLNPITCDNDTFQPSCNYTGYIKDLPTISIATGQNHVHFNVPPEIYVKNAKSRDDYVYSITLNIKALDNSLPDESYVTPDYSNTIILDQRTMSSFYLVFDAIGPINLVQIYQASTDPNAIPNHPLPKWVYIVIICVVVLIIAGSFGVAIRKRAANRPTPQVTQAPFIVPDASINSNNARIVSGRDYQYNAQGGNYYQQPQGVQYQPPITYSYE